MRGDYGSQLRIRLYVCAPTPPTNISWVESRVVPHSRNPTCTHFPRISPLSGGKKVKFSLTDGRKSAGGADVGQRLRPTDARRGYGASINFGERRQPSVIAGIGIAGASFPFGSNFYSLPVYRYSTLSR